MTVICLIKSVVTMQRHAQQGVVVGCVIAIIFVVIFGRDRTISQKPQTTASRYGLNDCLPGYTGWARPSSTLAGSFSILHPENATAYVDSDWEIQLSCHACKRLVHPSKLFVRASGPSILTGLVKVSDEKDRYDVILHPMQPGRYKLEVVMSYSSGIDFDAFPLSQLPPPYYEGYLINGFPFDFDVLEDKRTRVSQATMCTKEQLVISSGSWVEHWKRGYWKITSSVYENSYDSRNNSVSLAGYQASQNSIGFTAAYELSEGCQLVEKLEDMVPCTDQIVRIILIGDSVMRLQRDLFVAHLDPYKFEISFFELYGGILLCSRVTGPNITDLITQSSQSNTGNSIVIFNSGMHDIHRLCGHQFMDERRTYLSQTEIAMPCTALYERAFMELMITVNQIPASVRIFQTTHAAWPKYGNYGVAWDPRYAQELPLDAAFVERFNDVAVDVINRIDARIEMIDTFWMTLARPDNREISKNADIGKKLSHPGKEVLIYMAKILWQAAIQFLCEKV